MSLAVVVSTADADSSTFFFIFLFSSFCRIGLFRGRRWRSMNKIYPLVFTTRWHHSIFAVCGVIICKSRARRQSQPYRNMARLHNSSIPTFEIILPYLFPITGEHGRWKFAYCLYERRRSRFNSRDNFRNRMLYSHNSFLV